MKTLYPYQQQGYEQIKFRDKFALYWQMRLGKTVVTIRWLKAKQPDKCLIIAPLSVLNVWDQHLKDDHLSPILFTSKVKHGFNVISPIFKFPNICVTNYECFRDSEEMQSFAWDCIILDESTRIRKPDAKISKILAYHPAIESVPLKVVLSGNGAPESLLDYFMQFKFLFPSVLGCRNINEFKGTYFGSQWTPQYRPPHRATKAVDEMLRDDAFQLTRKEAGIGEKKIFEKRDIVLPGALRKIYDEFEKSWMLEIDEGDLYTQWALVANIYLHQIASGYCKALDELDFDHKVEEIVDLCKTDLQHEQVIIFSTHKKPLKATYNALSKFRQVRYIDGEVSIADREYYRQQLQNGSIDILCCQTKTVQYGLDCSAASTAIYIQNSFEREHRTQSQDRIVHPEKKEPLLYLDLVAENTIDNDVMLALERKTKNTTLSELIYENFLNRTGLGK